MRFIIDSIKIPITGIIIPCILVGVGDVGGLPEGDILAIIAVAYILCQSVEVVRRGYLVTAVAELVEVTEIRLAYGVGLSRGACVLTQACDGDGAAGASDIVTDGVVHALGESDGSTVVEFLVCDGWHRMVDSVVEVGSLDAVDGGCILSTSKGLLA